MNYFSLSNHELHTQTINAASLEKQATLVLLEYLAEVDRRQLYAERGFSSLWKYVHKELGYSEAQTSERVGTMRLMCRIPEVKESLSNHKLSLTSAAKLASFVRREKPSIEKTKELLIQVTKKSSREVEHFLLSEQQIPNARPDAVKTTGTTISRFAFDGDTEFAAMLARMKELQTDPTLSLQDLFKKAMKEYIGKRELKAPKIAVPSRNQHTASRAPEVQSIKTANRNSRYIPMSVKTFVRSRSKDQCEYIAKILVPSLEQKKDETAHLRCESRSQLQFDHIKPFAYGGKATKENIRHLCREHNFYEASKIFDVKIMDNYSRGKI